MRAKSFLSPRYIMFYLSTILFPIHLFTSYSPFLCSKSSYSLLPVIGKKDLSLPPQSWQAETQQNNFSPSVWKWKQGSHYWPGIQILPSCLWSFWYTWKKHVNETLVENVSQNHNWKWAAVHTQKHFEVMLLPETTNNCRSWEEFTWS